MKMVTTHNGQRIVREMTEAEQIERLGVSVTRAQGRVALHNAGLLDSAEAAVAAGGKVLQITWEDATIWYRKSAMIADIADALGLTDDDVDQLFKDAAAVAL